MLRCLFLRPRVFFTRLRLPPVGPAAVDGADAAGAAGAAGAVDGAAAAACICIARLLPGGFGCAIGVGGSGAPLAIVAISFARLLIYTISTFHLRLAL